MTRAYFGRVSDDDTHADIPLALNEEGNLEGDIVLGHSIRFEGWADVDAGTDPKAVYVVTVKDPKQPASVKEPRWNTRQGDDNLPLPVGTAKFIAIGYVTTDVPGSYYCTIQIKTHKAGTIGESQTIEIVAA